MDVRRICAIAGLGCALVAASAAVGCTRSPEPQEPVATPDASATQVAKDTYTGSEPAANEADADAEAAAVVAAAEPTEPAEPDVPVPAFEDIPVERVIGVEQLEAMIDGAETFQLIDIRNAVSYFQSHIENSVSIPAGQQIALRADEVDAQGTVVLIGKNNDRLAETRQILVDLGVPEQNILVVDGGIKAWEDAGYPLAKAEEGMYQC